MVDDMPQMSSVWETSLRWNDVLTTLRFSTIIVSLLWSMLTVVCLDWEKEVYTDYEFTVS
jgi:hypothetical protein